MQEQPEQELAAARQKLVLVVDDDAAIRHALAESLRHERFEVCVASTAEEALVLLESRLPIAAVITDVEMPGKLDGVNLVEVIEQSGIEVVVAVVSGKDSSSRLRSGVKFFRKPYSSAAIVSFLNGALQKS